jgi:UDP-N-acetylmuramoyl-tripeptide--D-alanyl-D-alanine ligase
MAPLADMARPDVAVVTAVGDAHHGNFTGRAQVAREKLEILGSLRVGGTAVLNRDDVYLRRAAKGRDAVLFGLGGGDVAAEGIRLDRDRTAFTLKVAGRRYKTWVRLLGEHHVANALAAVAAAWRLGGKPEKLAGRLKSFKPVSPMRMQLLTRRGIRIVNDAYNASPDSMRSALETFGRMPCPGRKAAVLGDMLELGDLSPLAHRKVLEQALAAGLDCLVMVGRFLPGAWVSLFGILPDLELGVEAVRSGDGRRTRILACGDPREAGRFLKGWARSGDAVFLKASRGIKLEKAIEGL